MTKINRKSLNTLLRTVTTGEEATLFIQTLFKHGLAETRRIGNSEESAGLIKMASDPFKALAEVLGSNTYDAHATKFLLENSKKVDLKGSPRDVISTRLGFPQGRFETLGRTNKGIQKALQETVVTLRGEVKSGVTPEYATIDVRDYGIGVENYKISNTLCGLGGGRKTFCPYLAGAFGQGSKVVLDFTKRDKHGVGNAVEMIVTRAQGQDEISVTFIWYDNRRDTAKTGQWLYLVDPTTGQPWTFKADKNAEFEAGTLVRIFDYKLGVQASDKFGSSDHDLVGQIRRTIPDPLAPLTFKDEREAPDSASWRRYLGSKRGKTAYMGSIYDLNHDRHVRSQGSYNIMFAPGEFVKLRWYVFSYDSGTDQVSRYSNKERPFILTMNGQTHGEFAKHLLTRDVGYAALNKRFVAFLDVDGLSHLTKRDLFSSTRESLKLSSDMRNLYQHVVQCLKGDDQLKKLNDEYRDSKSTSGKDSEDMILNQILCKHIKSMSTKNPFGSRKRQNTSENVATPPPLLNIPVNNPPTLFELQGATTRDIYPGQTLVVKVNTDASPALLSNVTKLLVDSPYTYLTYTHMSSPETSGGRLSFHFQVDPKAPVGSEATLGLKLKVSKTETLSVSLVTMVQEAPVKSPKEVGLPFSLEYLESDTSLDIYDMSREDVAVVRDVGGSRIMYLNLINKNFQSRLEHLEEDGRYSNPESLVYRTKLAFKSEAAISAWSAYLSYREMDLDPNMKENLMKCGSKSSIDTLLRTTATVKALKSATSVLEDNSVEN